MDRKELKEDGTVSLEGSLLGIVIALDPGREGTEGPEGFSVIHPSP